MAWIDCDLESVTEAGDHYIVLGRVRRLDVESTSLPLLFFQGGYGRFAPLSLAADGSGLVQQLRDVDLVRAEMERLTADIPGTRCNASALVDDEIVVLASAGVVDSASAATFVGERLPFIPPLGRVFAAWADDARVESWLKHLASDDERADEREWLAAVRDRGFSAILRTDSWQELEAARARLAADPAAVDREDLHGKIRSLDHGFVALSPGGQDRHRRRARPRLRSRRWRCDAAQRLRGPERLRDGRRSHRADPQRGPPGHGTTRRNGPSHGMTCHTGFGRLVRSRSGSPGKRAKNEHSWPVRPACTLHSASRSAGPGARRRPLTSPQSKGDPWPASKDPSPS